MPRPRRRLDSLAPSHHGHGSTGGGREADRVDVKGTPFAPLHDPRCIWARNLPEAGFGDLARGYIVLAPLDGLHRVNGIEGFVAPEKFAEALAVCEKCRWVKKGECKTPEALNAALAKRFAGGLVKGM